MIGGIKEMKGETYEQFVEKFKPKKTTDDCYTPEDVFNVILDYFMRELFTPLGFSYDDVIRPFWPGKDYTSEDYTGKIVIDNPPFSCLKEIRNFFKEKHIPAVLFCDSRYICQYISDGFNVYVMPGAITYENGAKVATSFITNVDAHACEVRTAPALTKAIESCESQKSKEKSNNNYPEQVITASMLRAIAKDSENEHTISLQKCVRVSSINGRQIYGSALIVPRGTFKGIMETINNVETNEKAKKEKREREKKKARIEITPDPKTKAIMERLNEYEKKHTGK